MLSKHLQYLQWPGRQSNHYSERLFRDGDPRVDNITNICIHNIESSNHDHRGNFFSHSLFH